MNKNLYTRINASVTVCLANEKKMCKHCVRDSVPAAPATYVYVFDNYIQV